MSKPEFTVSVTPHYLAEESVPEANHYVFAYTITVHNSGDVPAQLISRHWVITDEHQKIEEVRGLGVVGEQPFLHPGESFEYTSGTQLDTPIGTMQGEYQCTAEDGTLFSTPIPPFLLAVPRTLH